MIVIGILYIHQTVESERQISSKPFEVDPAFDTLDQVQNEHEHFWASSLQHVPNPKRTHKDCQEQRKHTVYLHSKSHGIEGLRCHKHHIDDAAHSICFS